MLADEKGTVGRGGTQVAQAWIWFKIRSARKYRGAAPEPGDVWWAALAFVEDAGTVKDRPVIIKSVRPDEVIAFYVTSQAKESRHRFTPLACASTWDPAGRQSWAKYSETREIPLANLRRSGASLPSGEFQRLYDLHAGAVGTRPNWA
ncbi:type II toxin-antitoxin system PemK/MazF family toxin [Streptomyces sp. NPDC096324]|uniref:type II toxin-antitoxin system PemK/MazF family toxin n=1 Tax=Streptomyces sp. NPDC096324 TaxID=3366085 RepID=UPI00381362AC